MPLGRRRFRNETGIVESDWYGKFWRTWGDAVREAGYPPNKVQRAFAEDYIIGKLVELIRELGRSPVVVDLLMKARSDAAFPSRDVFKRIGTKAERAQKVIDYCGRHEGLADVAALCQPIAATRPTETPETRCETEVVGLVYLIRCGRLYKIGRTKSAARRQYELAVQLPQRAKMVHGSIANESGAAEPALASAVLADPLKGPDTLSDTLSDTLFSPARV